MGLGDKHSRFSTPVSHASRFEFLDGAVHLQPSPKVRLSHPDATRFDESRLGDKHNYYSTPISDNPGLASSILLSPREQPRACTAGSLRRTSELPRDAPPCCGEGFKASSSMQRRFL